MKGKQRLAGSFLAVAMACAPGCVTGPINIAALLQSATTSQPAQAASPAPTPVSTESAQPVEKRITFTKGQSWNFPLSARSNSPILSFLLDGKGDISIISVFRSGTSLTVDQHMKFRARLQANGRDISTVPLINVDKDKIVFKTIDGSSLLHVDGQVQMVLRLDGDPLTAEDIDALNALKATISFTIATASFDLADGTTMADFPPFSTERPF